MLIAICDDEQVFCDKLRLMILAFKEKRRLHMDVVQFGSGVELLQSGKVFDMVFLDYQMPGMDGMQVARELRRRNCTASIVFITSHPQFILESFEVQPYRFFIKPLMYTQVETLMLSFVEQQKMVAPLVVINDCEQMIVQSKDILYLEGNGKYCIVRTSEKTYNSSKTLAQVHALLPQHCFYRTHKSYVVNLYGILSFGKDSVTMVNGEVAQLGRHKSADFKKTYKQFLKDYYIEI